MLIQKKNEDTLLVPYPEMQPLWLGTCGIFGWSIIAEKTKKYHGLSEPVLDGISRYVLYGTRPGHFTSGLLMNSLTGAAGAADDYNQRRLFGYAVYLSQCVPSAFFGSREIFEDHIRCSGYYGKSYLESTDALVPVGYSMISISAPRGDLALVS